MEHTGGVHRRWYGDAPPAFLGSNTSAMSGGSYEKVYVNTSARKGVINEYLSTHDFP